MPRSDRERGEGFHRPLYSVVAGTASERGEGFHRLPSPATPNPTPQTDSLALEDVAVGAPYNDSLNRTAAGAAYVV